MKIFYYKKRFINPSFIIKLNYYNLIIPKVPFYYNIIIKVY